MRIRGIGPFIGALVAVISAACSSAQSPSSARQVTPSPTSALPVAPAPPAPAPEVPGAPNTAAFEAIVRGIGEPVAFDQAFAEVREVPRFKGEFETSAQFKERQVVALAKCHERYLIAVPVDPEYVRYDADRQLLIVATYAFTNTVASSEDLSAAFGYGSELSKAGVEIKYTTISSNVMWSFPREQEDVGTYDGSNAFGVTATITKQKGVAEGVFEREGKYDEDVWTETPEGYTNDGPMAFEIKAGPERAKSIKQGGLRAAILVAPKAPYYATGVHRFSPTIRAPYDRTTDVRYLIGDVQCVGIYDSDGELIATRATR